MAFVFSINEVMGGGVGYKRDIVSFVGLSYLSEGACRGVLGGLYLPDVSSRSVFLRTYVRGCFSLNISLPVQEQPGIIFTHT